MTNTEGLYAAISEYTRTRAAARDEYLRAVSAIADAKGSKYYTDREQDAAAKRAATMDAAQAKARKSVAVWISDMEKSARNLKLTPPTQDQLNILQMLKLRDKLTEAELDQAANSMDGNGAMLALLNELALKHGYMGGYSRYASESLTIDQALELLRNLDAVCASIIDNRSGANAVRLMGAEHNARLYGGEVNPDELPQEPGYSDEFDFYRRCVSVPYAVFSKAVNN